MKNSINSYILNNNLNWIRLILASMVIVGHSYAVAPTDGAQDVIKQLVGFTYSGALAVKIFFLLAVYWCVIAYSIIAILLNIYWLGFSELSLHC